MSVSPHLTPAAEFGRKTVTLGPDCHGSCGSERLPVDLLTLLFSLSKIDMELAGFPAQFFSCDVLLMNCPSERQVLNGIFKSD